VKCSIHFGAKRRGFIKSEIVLAPKGASQNFIKNIRYDRTNVEDFNCFLSHHKFKTF